MASFRRIALAVLGVVSLGACGGGGTDERQPVDGAGSSLVASPGSAVADGTAAVTVTATARDASGRVLSGRPVLFAVTGDATLSATDATTGAEGTASVTLTSTVAGPKTVSVVLDGVTLDAAATVTFVAGPPARVAFTLPPADTTAGTAFAARVSVADAHGNAVGGTAVSVALEGGPSGAALSGTTAGTTAADGAVSFDDLAVVKAGSGYALTATADLAQGTSTVFAVAAGSPSPAGSQVAASPAAVVAGEGVSTLTVRLVDAWGNAVPGVAVDVTTTGGTLSSAGATTDADGSASVTVGSTVAGTVTVTFAFTGGALELPVAFAAGPAVALELLGLPERTAAGTSTGLSLLALDAHGNVAPSYRGTVRITTSDAAAVLWEDVVFGPEDGGTHLAMVGLRTAGPTTVTATDTVDPGLTDSAVTTVTPAAGVALAFTAEPAAVVAGEVVSPAVEVTVRDAYGNVATDLAEIALALSGGPAGATLRGALSATTFGGRASFADLSIQETGSGYRLVATSPDLATATSAPFGVAPAAPDAVASDFTASPASLVAGSSAALAATVRDAFGNPVPGASVAFAATGEGNTFTPATATTDAAGAAAGSLSSTKAEAKTVTAVAGGVTLAAQPVVTFVAGEPAQVVFTQPPTDPAAGTAFAVRLSVADAHGNPVEGAAVSVALQSGPPGATLSGTTTGTTAADGTVALEDLLLVRAGDGYALGANAGTAQGTSGTFAVAPGPAAALELPGLPAVTAAGTSLATTVRAVDAHGNVATGYRGTLHFTSSDAAAVLPEDVVFTASDAGTRTAAVELRTAGTRTITVADVAAPSLVATASVSVAHAPAARLVLGGLPASATAGSALAATITVQDAFGNVASGYRGTVVFTSSDTTAVLPAPYPFTEGDAGARTFSVELRTAGAATVTATDTVDAGVTGSAALTVVPGAAAALGFTIEPTAVVAGQVMAPPVEVTVRDAFGNVATDLVGIVLALTGGSPGATLRGTSSTVAVDGRATFADLTIQEAASEYRLTATSSGLLAATSAPFGVAPGAPDAVASDLTASPTSLVAGSSAALAATVRDAFGNPVPGASVSFAATGEGNTFTPPATTTDATGLAAGSLSSTKAEAKTVTAVAGGVTLAAQPVVTFVAGPFSAARSSVTAAPSSVVADGSTPTVVTIVVVDEHGNPVQNVWVELMSTRPADVPEWPFAVSDASGAARFEVRSTLAGTSTFSAFVHSDPWVTVAQTAAVEFVAGPVSADRSTVVPSPPTVPGDGTTPVTLAVTLLDAHGNPVSGKTVTLASSRGEVDAISPPSAISDGSGLATFSATSSTLGVASFSATDASDGLVLAQAAQVPFTGPVSAARSTVAASPAAVVADGAAAGTVTVTLLDDLGNPVSGKTVALVSSRGATDTISAASGVSDGSGLVTFAVSSPAFGTSSFSATDASDGLALAETASVTFTSYLAFATPPPDPATSGIPFDPPPVVVARDAAGNVDAAFTADVALALGANPAGGTLDGPLTVVAAAGVATFPGLLLDKAGTGYTLRATTTAPGIRGAESGPFRLVPGSPARLVFTVQPSNTGAGIRPIIQVELLDAQGNATTATGLDVTVALGTNPSGAALGGALTSASVDGTATFQGLTVSAPGVGYTLVASDAPDGLAPATSEPFDVTAPAVVGSGTPSSCTEAALSARLAAGGHIAFDCGPDPVTIVLTSQKTIAVNTGIDGGGLVTLSGGGTTPLFAVSAGRTLALSNLGITGGWTGGVGGAIFNGGGTLSLGDCRVFGNGASASSNYYGSPANGGAIFNAGGTVLVDRSTFSGNAVSSSDCYYGTTANGGAIFHGGGTLLVTSSTFRGNTATGNHSSFGTAGNGGAIFGSGKISIFNSTLAGNSASGANSPFGTGGNGGAIFNGGGSVSIVSSTLAGNSASMVNGWIGVGGQGGAVYGGGTLANTVVARGASGANCSGTFVNGGPDLDSDGTCGLGPATDPLLDPAGLADHGGPTETIALQPGSPAIDAGDPAICAGAPLSGLDQRGYARPGAGATRCSIGAFEFGSSGPP